VKRTLKRWKYPPVGEEAAIDLVLEQAEALSNAWSRWVTAGKIKKQPAAGTHTGCRT